MKKYFISILLLVSNLFAALLHPENGSTLTTTHVKFEWEQVPDATEYIIEINGSDVATSESLIYISTNDLMWNTEYSWTIKPAFSDGTTGSSTGNYIFSIADTRSSATTTGTYEGNEVTIFSSFLDYYSAAIDKDGNEIWNSSDENLIFYNTDYYGQLFGAKYDNTLENNLPVVEYNLDNQIIWQEPNEYFSHHEMIQLPNGNYMSILEDIRLGPIPINLPNSLSLLFQLLGYVADGTTEEFPWVGDRIVEWDSNGNEVWSWSAFDYYSQFDYDTIAGTWAAAFNDARFDWTHANAFWFSEEENAIYFSVRHLSRITKIDYATGDIIWNMGLEMPSGDIDCGQDLGFSFQHSIMELNNGNILTLDNGNISETINNTDYPTTRALEITINESENSCEATIAWSYNLPEELFGFASGNVQKLDSGNYLITTVGGGGTTLEVTPDNQIIWEATYNLSFPKGAVYRANRLPSLYPVEFSIVIPNMYLDNTNITIDADNQFDILIYNDGTKNETFCIEELNDCILIEANDKALISVPISSNVMTLTVIPDHREDLEKNITVHINGTFGSDCDPNFTYFELENIPNSAIVLDGSQCFSNIDLAVLNDIITDNNLSLNPIEVGTQNWFNGHLTRLTIGNFYDGGNITLTTLPESIGNLPNIAILYLNYNELTSLPDSITNLTNLIWLILSFNNLTHLPESIGNLSNMIWLDLGYNSLESIPESIGNFSMIDYLWIFNNNLSELPESICNLDLDWNGLDANFLPYFGSGGNMLCENLPECVENSENINTSIDPLYYSFLITVEQDCCGGEMDVNGDGILNVVDIISLVNTILGA